MEWEDAIDNSPTKKQCCDELLLKLSDLVHPILAEKDSNAVEIQWKATVLSFHDNFANDPLARYVHKFAALDACKTRATEQENDEIVYQDSQLPILSTYNLQQIWQFARAAKRCSSI